ncbi:MAG: hypothetical protein GX224_00825 [Thermoplasmatales archaeon]|nr:hypothetical protein [Thermoplasmatales archaeon]
MSLEDRFLRLKEDPERAARLFRIFWVVAYSMLILGGALIVWVLFSQKTL